MKRLFIILSCLACLQSRSQMMNPFPKTINVNGSAEIELIPDEIYVQVDLKEYQKRGDKDAKKIAADDPGIDFRKIKLKFDVNVVFALK